MTTDNNQSNLIPETMTTDDHQSDLSIETMTTDNDQLDLSIETMTTDNDQLGLIPETMATDTDTNQLDLIPETMATDTKQLSLTIEAIATIVEGLLFVADQPVSISELATTIEVSNSKIEKALEQLTETYQNRYLKIQQHKNKVQLVTAPQITSYIERFLGLSQSSKLSTAALEALGIIAYKQPLTRAQIEAIRGVNCDGVIRTLLSKGLIESVGRLDTVGHPIQYGTTFEFLKYFGLSSLDELPELEMDEIEGDEFV